MAVMDLHEFELRYHAYTWMNTRLGLGWDEETIINLTKITNKWVLEKSVPETSPEDLRRFTHETYTPFKVDMIERHRDFFPLKTSQYSLADYIERLEYELKVVKSMWFNTYFLIVSDYVRWAKRQMIVVWPWRGSWAGSLLAWMIEITDIDPLPFDLLFERFLNPARISMPDFDIDFEDTQRQKVIDYCTQKYGQEKVCSIWTFMKMATKAAFKDSARALGIPFDKSNQITNLIPEKVSLKDIIANWAEYEELHTIFDTDEKVKKAFELASNLEWNLRQLWVHACWIIIAPEAVSTYTAAQYVKEDDHTVVSQYDWPTMEGIWLLKMDFLWLRNLSIIKNAIKIISKKYEKEGKELPEMYQHFLETTSFQPDITDQATYEVFKEWDTTWIFQFESPWMRKYLIQLQPTAIHDLVAMNALYRPWPMDFIPSYIARSQWIEEIRYMSDELRSDLTKKYWADVAEEENKKLIEDLSPIMNITHGIAIYQEQLMFLVQAMAWFSLGEADLLRRWVGKKKKEVIEKLKKEFISRWETYRWYKPETTTNIYEKMIEPAASYSFNKSHSVCYAFVAYQTAYLKAHFPVEFSAALIRSVEEDIDTQSFYISEIQNKGIKVLSPDVNESYNHVAAIGEDIRLWFISVKWIWEDVWEFIQQERQKNWQFSSLEDFLKRCSSVINKKSLEWLVKSWALDCFNDRKILLNNIDVMLDWIKNVWVADFWLFWWIGLDTSIPLKKVELANHMEKLMMEHEVLKVFVSWNPLDGLYQYIKKFSFINQVLEQDQVQKFVIIWYIKEVQRAKKKWFFVKIEDISWNWEFFVREAPDVKNFDLIILHWSKNNGRIYLDKMVKTDYPTLKSLAGWKFDPEWTVVRAKKERYWDKKNQIKTIGEESWKWVSDNIPILSQQEKIEEDILGDEVFQQDTVVDEAFSENFTGDVVAEDDWENMSEDSLHPEESELEPKDEPFSIKDLPDSFEKINIIATVLKNYPWDILVYIAWQEKRVSEEWLEKLKSL